MAYFPFSLTFFHTSGGGPQAALPLPTADDQNGNHPKVIGPGPVYSTRFLVRFPR